jgi:intein/homing endonuclease
MKKLLFIGAAFLSFTAFTQFESISFYSMNRSELVEGNHFEEVNTFNVSVPDKIIIHNRFPKSEEATSQIYRIVKFDQETSEEGYVVLYFKLASDLDIYEMFISENEDGEFALLESSLFFGKVYNFKIDR